MLKIYLGDMENAIYHPPVYFDNSYDDDWITNSLSVDMIKDIDKSEVVGVHLIQSPVLGPISAKDLSGGVKTLILMNNDSEHIFNASACGDNCAKWILKIAEKKDLTIRLGYLMDFGKDNLNIEIVNLGKTVHNGVDLVESVLDNHLI
jgi:hypothetical protein